MWEGGQGQALGVYTSEVDDAKRSDTRRLQPVRVDCQIITGYFFFSQQRGSEGQRVLRVNDDEGQSGKKWFVVVGPTME